MRRESTEKGHTKLKVLPVVVQRHEHVVQRHEAAVLENMQAKLGCTCLSSFYIVVVLRIEVLLAYEWPLHSEAHKNLGTWP